MLGDGGEAAHVAEQNGHAALLAAQHQLFRRARQLLDHVRRQIIAEGGADLLALLLLAEIIDEGQHQIDQPARNQRIGEIDQQAVRHEQIPRQAEQPGDQQGADRHHDRRRQQRRGDDDGEPEPDRQDDFGADGIFRIGQQRLGQHAFEDFGVHLDAGHRRLDRRGLDVEQADRRGADEHQSAAQPVRSQPPLQDVLGGYVTRRIVLVEMHPELAVAVGRHHQPRHRHRLHAGLPGVHQDGAGVADDAQHFHGQRRHQRALRLHDHRDAADDAVAFRIDRKQSASGRRLLDRQHIAQQPGKAHQKRRRVGADDGKSGLQRQFRLRARLRRRRSGLADHHVRVLDRVGQHLVVAGKAVEFCAGRVIEAAEAFRGNRAATCGRARQRRYRSRSRRRPPRVMRVTRSATSVRGHGHCPISFRLASSISTMTTGRTVCWRGRST